MVTATYRRPADVAMVLGTARNAADSGADTVYLSHLASGLLIILEGTAALIYSEALRDTENSSDMSARIADLVGVPAEEVRGDVEGFLVELTTRGLLQAT